MAIEQTESGLTQNGFIPQEKEEASEDASLQDVSTKEMDEVYSLVFSRFPFMASSPGGSLTGKLKDDTKGTLGSYPWENPAIYDKPTDAFSYLLDSLEGKQEDIQSLLYAGVPTESIARAVTFLGFTEGLFSVDISELLVIPLMFNMLADAQDQGIEASIFNDADDDEIDMQSVLDTMEDLKPDQYKSIMEDATMKAEEENMIMEEIEQDPLMGSFLSMGEE